MVPVVPFSVFFAAIVSAQQLQCYSLSGIYLNLPGCLPPQPPPLTIIFIPAPSKEEWINHDVWRLRKNCHLPPRGMPPYVTHGGTLFQKESDCTKRALSNWGEGEPLRVQHCMRPDICHIDEIPPRSWGPEPSVQAWNILNARQSAAVGASAHSEKNTPVRRPAYL
jgi:hypothetical protein